MVGIIVFYLFCLGYCLASVKHTFTPEERKGVGYTVFIIFVVLIAFFAGPYLMGRDVHKLYTSIE